MLDPLSIRAGAAGVFADHTAAHLEQLTAPLDDMWAAFAEGAAPYALCSGARVIGSCSVDEAGRLLRYYVEPGAQARSTELLRRVIDELGVTEMMVFTHDPIGLSAALDLAVRVEPDTLICEQLCEPEVEGLDELVVADVDQHARIVAFQVQAVGAPLEFLEVYARERLERRELLTFEQDGQLLSVGELRRDSRQPGIAHLGMIVQPEQRGRGIGSRMLTSLVALSRAEGLRPHCSTEVTNIAARRVIERGGFRANHRLLRVTFG